VLRFEIGDRVRVRTDLEEESTYDTTEFDYDMVKYLGLVVTIAGTDDNDDTYLIEEDGHLSWWADEMFDELEIGVIAEWVRKGANNE
jgi:hypothetical protein